MRIKFLMLLLLTAITTYGQNKKILIPGTRIYLEKPESFSLATDFIGLESGQSVIQFMDISEGNYNSNSKNFTKENFENEGITVIYFKNTEIGGYPAKLTLLQGNPNQKSLQLIFGDNEFLVMAMAFVPNFEKEKIKKIENAFHTIEYDKTREINPFEIAFFELDDSASSYKYSKTISNMFLYTKGGVKKDNFMNESAYLVSQFPIESNWSPKSLVEKNLNSLSKNGLTISKRTPTDRKKINGFQCYEELIIGTLNNSETQIIITSIVNETRALVVTGVAKDNFETTLQEFKKLTNEIKMK